MPFVSGFLKVHESGHPDHPGNALPGGGHIDNTLPGGGHIDNELPGGGHHPWVPGHLPSPPPGAFPPPSATLPIAPAPPDTPPGAIWPPIGNPPIWSGGVHPPAFTPGTPPPRPTPAPPSDIGGAGSGKFWVVAGIPGLGWRYVCVDPSLRPEKPPVEGGGKPEEPTPEPK